MDDAHAAYDAWGGSDPDSAAGRQFRAAIEDLSRCYGETWPSVAAAIIAGNGWQAEHLAALADACDSMAIRMNNPDKGIDS